MLQKPLNQIRHEPIREILTRFSEREKHRIFVCVCVLLSVLFRVGDMDKVYRPLPGLIPVRYDPVYSVQLFTKFSFDFLNT